MGEDDYKQAIQEWFDSIGYKGYDTVLSEKFKNEFKTALATARSWYNPQGYGSSQTERLYFFRGAKFLKGDDIKKLETLIYYTTSGASPDKVTEDPLDYLNRLWLMVYGDWGAPQHWSSERWQATAKEYKNRIAQFYKELDDKIPQEYGPSEEIYKEEKALISAAAIGAASYYLDKDWKNAVLLGALTGGFKYGAEENEQVKQIADRFETNITDKNVLFGSTASIITNRILKRGVEQLAFGLPIAVAGSYLTDKVVEYAYDAYYKFIGIYIKKTTPEPPFIVDGRDMTSVIRQWM